MIISLNTTDEELINFVEMDNAASPRERALAERLSDALRAIETHEDAESETE